MAFRYLYPMKKHQNALASESSLYLLQHANNPVNWVAWSPAAFEQAERENKLVLVSVGYSACHWCHVMEHESFENETVAELMNQHFICIKVDREERPDVDQVYMAAVQLMTQRGGWPLNCFTLPNGKPIYGGTYFPKDQWMHILGSLQHTFTSQPEKVLEYAEQLTDGVKNAELVGSKQELVPFEEEKLDELMRRWTQRMDTMEGGPTSAPKFPLPNNYLFLLQYGHWKKDIRTLNYVSLSLEKMARGGIYDQLGGGFSRYSVDMLWKVPHFEKMLYDNGQLLEVYAEAYRKDPTPEYARLMQQTTAWLSREMLSEEGGFFAAQDADSEGVEGKFYVWNPAEIEEIIGKDAKWFLELFNPQNKGYWEDDMWILLRNVDFETFLKHHPELTLERIQTCMELLFKERQKRIAPGTDTKCITSWNALTIKGLAQAYRATGDESYLYYALKAAKWILNFQTQENGGLWHVRQNGVSKIQGFLDDYSFTISAFITLHEVTGDTIWISQALTYLEYVQTNFRDTESDLFYFTEASSDLIARKMEINDNVLPSTNSEMAHNLLTLGLHFYNSEWITQSRQMLMNLYDGMEHYGSGYSNWARLLQRFLNPMYCVHVKGPKANESAEQLLQLSSPNFTFHFEQKDESEYLICTPESCIVKVGDLTALKQEILGLPI